MIRTNHLAPNALTGCYLYSDLYDTVVRLNCFSVWFALRMLISVALTSPWAFANWEALKFAKMTTAYPARSSGISTRAYAGASGELFLVLELMRKFDLSFVTNLRRLHNGIGMYLYFPALWVLWKMLTQILFVMQNQRTVLCIALWNGVCCFVWLVTLNTVSFYLFRW